MGNYSIGNWRGQFNYGGPVAVGPSVQYAPQNGISPFGQINSTKPATESDTFSTNRFHPDMKLDNIADFTPEKLRQLGDIQGVVIDLDNTLMPNMSGKFPPQSIECLKRLQQAGIKVMVVSNNPNDTYCQKAEELLHQAGLNIPLIGNAQKPDSRSFKLAEQYFGLPPEKMAAVGDGIILDNYGGNQAGMKTIRGTWYDKGILGTNTGEFLFEAAAVGFDKTKRLFGFDSKPRLYGFSAGFPPSADTSGFTIKG